MYFETRNRRVKIQKSVSSLDKPSNLLHLLTYMFFFSVVQRREKPDRVRRSTQDGGDLPVSTWCTSMSMTYLSNNYTERYFEWKCCITWLSFKIFYIVRDSTNIRGSLKTIVFSSMGRGGVGVSTVSTDLFVYNDSERFYYNRGVIFQRVSWFQWIWKSECSL